MSEVRCPLCRGESVSQIYSRTRESKDMKVFQCHECDIGFLERFNHIPQGYYEDNAMFADPMKGKSVRERINHFDQENKKRFERYERIIVNKKVLDYGCAAGGFLRYAKGVASEVVGVDPSSLCLEYLTSTGYNVGKDLAAIESHTGTFDLIFAFHVFEHLPDPRFHLSQLADFLVPDGRIIIEVPNRNDVMFKLYNDAAYKLFNLNDKHLWYYTEKSLRNLAMYCDLEVEYIEYAQRYPLANHLYWMEFGSPGGEKKWFVLDDETLNKEYARVLASHGMTDAVAACLRLR